MIPKKIKYRHEEKQVEVLWMGKTQVYDVMLIEDKDYLYAVIDIQNALTSPVNITNVLSSRRMLEPDFWVYVDHQMSMEDTKSSTFSCAPNTLVQYYFEHREQPVPAINIFGIREKELHHFELTLENDVLQCIIDPEFKDIYLDRNYLFDAGFKDMLHAAVYEILQCNIDFFKGPAGAQWLSLIFSSSNLFLALGLWNALATEDRALMVSSASIPESLLHIQKNNLEDQLFL